MRASQIKTSDPDQAMEAMQTLSNFVLEYLGQIVEPLGRIGESNWKLRLTKLLPERKKHRFAKHTFASRHCVILKPNRNPNRNLNLKQAICEFHFSDWEGQPKMQANASFVLWTHYRSASSNQATHWCFRRMNIRNRKLGESKYLVRALRCIEK